MKVAWSKWMRVRGVVLAGALTLCGCASITENTHAYLGSPRLAPTPAATVQIFATEPKQPKERLGEIILSVAGHPTRQKLEDRLRTAAAQWGASGVFIAADRTQVYPVTYWGYGGPVTSEYWHRLIVGVAFKNK